MAMDPEYKRMMMWVLIALVACGIFSFLMVEFVIWRFGG